MPGSDQQVSNQNQQQAGITNQSFNTGQTQNQSGSTVAQKDPWSKTEPLLTQLLAKYSGANTDVTGSQSSAVDALKAGADATPQFGDAAAGGVNKLFTSDTGPQVGMLRDALTQLQGNIGGTASGAGLDPYSTPGFSQALETMTNDITNKVKGVYAGSGRDPSGAGSFAKTLGRGITEGVAPSIVNQFNANKGNQLKAASDLFSAGSGTAGAITGQEQVPLANVLQGIGALPGVNAAYTAPGAAKLGAANVEQNLPYGNLQALLGPLLGLSQLGGTQTGSTTGGTSTTGTGSSLGSTLNFGQAQGTTTVPQSTFGNVLGGITGAAGLASLFGGAGGASSLLPLLALSDKRMKTDIAPVGMLNDGQKVFRYKLKGSPKMQIGLLAQKVEDYAPEAVHNIGGVKLLDYGKATDKAAEMERTT